MKCLALDTHMKTAGTTQYLTFPFRGLVSFKGKTLAISEQGLFQLGGSSDAGPPIVADLRIPMGDLGSSNKKRIRFLHFGVEADSDLEVTLIADGQMERTYAVKIPSPGKQRAKVPVGRDITGRYWQARVRNPDGGRFALESIHATVVVRALGHV